MRIRSIRAIAALGCSLPVLALATPAMADEAEAAAEGEAIVVTGQHTSYNNAAVTESMIVEQPPLASALDVVDTLPGVQVQEGDAFGFDDWSTTVSIRGFQTNLDTQQVGITIDGLPNGDSNYGGGSKANRYIDTMNLATVKVSQGTADIGSLSNEALGGTLDFVTSDPLDEMRLRLSGSAGTQEARRYYGRLDTGAILGGKVKAWFSYAHQEATDWAEGSARNHRDNFAAKFVVDLPVRLTGYVSYDDAYENNYDQLYSAGQYVDIPAQDGLTGTWTGIPAIDQNYRGVWGTLRKNFFSYLKADAQIGGSINLHAAAYYHDMAGRGDWAPPYVVDLTADGAGNPESEMNGTSNVQGGSPIGRIYFVNAAGVALSAAEGCTNLYDPSCYAAGAIGAQSYRHTHYRKDRKGGTADASWKADLGIVQNTLRGGVWYEDTHRSEWRDWHNVIDTAVGPDYAPTPYWTQYNREYPQSTFKWYVQDELSVGPVRAQFGAKQFHNEVDRIDLQATGNDSSLAKTSRVLFSGGAQFEPVKGLELFAGYAENFKALSDALLEYNDADISDIKPETAKNYEAGVRYQSGWVQASATWFKSKFSNQVIFVSNTTSAGPDYLGEGDGKFFNAGGIDSKGFELLLNLQPVHGLNLYGAYTHIDAKYIGTGNAALDAEQGVTPGNRVTGIPKDMWVLSGAYTYGPVHLGVTGKYTGSRFANAANTLVARDYFLTDLTVGVKGEALSTWLKALEFSLNVNNLTDERYLGGISGGYAWIGAPRSTVFTVTADF